MHTAFLRCAVVGSIAVFGAPARAQSTAVVMPVPVGRDANAITGSAIQHPADIFARRVSLDVQDQPLGAVLQEIDRQARLGLTYTSRVVPLDRRISFHGDSITVGEALRAVLHGTGVRAVPTAAGTVALIKALTILPDTVLKGGIGGVVRDSTNGRPINGATVAIGGTNLVAITQDSGVYFFADVPAGMHVITARYLGRRPQSVNVMIVAGQFSRVDIVLPYTVQRLDQVVTTATGPQRRMELGNAITVLDADSIARAEPVGSLTDMLATRVPGLDVRPTTGAPGDPQRLRLRGTSSPLRSNDPVVIVDGVRVYAAQSDPQRGGNLVGTYHNTGGGTFQAGLNGKALPAPSPVDQIDPNSIESIEVFKGPSAATLYGPDAANGVIVITTKRGHPGPARWSVSADRATSFYPGRFADSYLRFGHQLNTRGGIGRVCPITDFTCAQDSLVRYQILNDPMYTVLGHGATTGVSASVSGGTQALNYAVTGSLKDEIGLLHLPEAEVQRYQNTFNTAPPSWMRQPHGHRRWSTTANVTAHLNEHTTASITSVLTREKQQRSSLENQLTAISGTFVDRTTGIVYQPVGLSGFTTSNVVVPDFYYRTTDEATNYTNSLSLEATPRRWLRASATAGLNVIGRDDEELLPPGLITTGSVDPGGHFYLGRGTSFVSTVTAGTQLFLPLKKGFEFRLNVGANYAQTRTADLISRGDSLAANILSLNGAAHISTSEQRAEETTFGWYVEPQLGSKRFWLNTGLRLDGGNTYGTHVSLAGLPKLNLSYLISDEPWFPFKSVFTNLRLRTAYGRAGVQPGPTDRLRLYKETQQFLNGGVVDVTQIAKLGNTQLRPERSTEFELGFDTDLFDYRVSLEVSGYRKTRDDALMNVPVPPSVSSGVVATLLKNVGKIRNTGFEVAASADILRTDPVSWSIQANISRNHNTVLSLGRGVTPFTGQGGTRVAPGYPLLGVWARPIVGYSDTDGNGILQASEVQVGDTAIFMGNGEPNYEASFHTSFAFFRRAVTVTAGFDYQNGLTQVNQTLLGSRMFLRASNDTTAPLPEQAIVVVSDFGPNATLYGLVQKVSTLRFNSLAITYSTPASAARRLGAQQLSISAQGTNLGLFTNYRGKDPNVNAFGTGNTIADYGQLPAPRTLAVRVSATY